MNLRGQEQPLLENFIFWGGSSALEVFNLDPWKLLITLSVPSLAPTFGEPALLRCGPDHIHLYALGWWINTISLELLRVLWFCPTAVVYLTICLALAIDLQTVTLWAANAGMAELPSPHCADMSYGATKAMLETRSNVVQTRAHQDDLACKEAFPGSVLVVAVNFGLMFSSAVTSVTLQISWRAINPTRDPKYNHSADPGCLPQGRAPWGISRVTFWPRAKGPKGCSPVKSGSW